VETDMSLIQADNLEKHYGANGNGVTALAGVSLSVAAGEFVAVMGRSGSGKSSLLSVLGAMNAPSSGTLTVDGIDVYGLSPERRADFRRRYLGFVFQGVHLLPYMTVLENVMLPLAVEPGAGRDKQSMAANALAQVGLGGKEKRLPHALSGGEKERVAVARAIVNRPPILLADEPTGSLDSKTAAEIMDLLSGLNRDGTTVVMVTHDAVCAAFARRLLTVADGRLVN